MVHLLIAIIYISFISLGLPDGLLGASWPSMYGELGVDISFAGIVSMIIAGGTVISSLMSERLVKKLGTGAVTALSVAMTACALFGFSISGSFAMLCVWAVPYGLGAGSVDAALNNYVAVNYSSRHMSWLHCFWGVGCATGPYIIAWFLTSGKGWTSGYGAVSLMQFALTAMLVFSLPLWKKVAKKNSAEEKDEGSEILGLKRTISIKGVKAVMIAFFAYCAVESTASLWAVSYIVLHKGVPAVAGAKWGSIFFLGITVGRFLNGFLTAKFSDKTMIRAGQGLAILGIIVLLLPFGNPSAVVGLVLLGLGCAPIYPSLIHATPSSFGKNASQAVIGVQMASAYVGTCLMPPIFGLLAKHISISLFPIFMLVMATLMVVMSEWLNSVVKKQNL